ncbi:MAG: ribosomal RNA small subunit methyltransferase A [Deltaproteobacteria bacterium]|nr:ribosomal RNA small subunit methyltransferase A [Deltaproteobacteria bacterium]
MTDSFIHPNELKKRYSFLAKKSLGQNFLVHRPILETISQKILEKSPQTLLEIGPGPGSLSQLLAPKVQKMILVEKDEQFETLLQEIVAPLGNIKIIREDFLKVDLNTLILPENQPCFAVGNLPYNVSIPILQKLMEFRHLFSRLFLMFQKEVALRLCAKPNTKDYGSLSVYIQMLADLKMILPIPPSAFDPRPKIQSAVVEIIPLLEPREKVNLPFFEKVVQAAFNPRRKTLSNNLKTLMAGHLSKEKIDSLLEATSINPQRRGETLSLKEFAKLSQVFEAQFNPK